MFLDVGNGHSVYVEEYGNPHGIQILFLHGGPGLGFSEMDKVLFDPDKFHVIFMDQRGCGRSTPKGELRHNTTSELLDDIDKVLNFLSIDTVFVFGGSWGATLAVLYAAKRPHRVDGMILRGFFPATKNCTDIYLRGEIKHTHPNHWQQLINYIPSAHHERVAEYVFETVINEEPGVEELAYAWAAYGLSLSRKTFSDFDLQRALQHFVPDLDRIKIELNYALQSFFIPEDYVYQQAKLITNTPVTVIHGRYDYLCPPEYAERLSKCIKRSNLIVVDAGHSTAEKEIVDALLAALKQL